MIHPPLIGNNFYNIKGKKTVELQRLQEQYRKNDPIWTEIKKELGWRQRISYMEVVATLLVFVILLASTLGY